MPYVDDASMPPRTPTVCVLGTGSIGLRHVEVLRRAGARVVAVPARPERVAELRAQGIEAVASLEAIDGELSGAVVATDTARHVADALRLGASCPVLVEKPLATTAASAQPLRGLAKAVHVACVLRFNPGLQWVRAKLGALGAVRLVDAECLSWLPAWRPQRDYRAAYSSRPGEGGVLRDLVHEIDYTHWLFGAPVALTADVSSAGVLGLPPAVDESALLTMRLAGGARASLRLSFAVRPESRRLRVWGEHGCLTWDALARRAWLTDADGKELDATAWDAPRSMYDAQATAWLGTLEGRASDTLATLADGLAALRTIDAARDASERLTWEKLS